MAMYQIQSTKRVRGSFLEHFFVTNNTTFGELERLTLLAERLKEALGYEAKFAIIEEEESVKSFCLHTWMPGLTQEEGFVVKSVLAIGQQKALLHADLPRKRKLVDMLISVERFYQEMGGLVGYHATLLQFLQSPPKRFSPDKVRYHAPSGLDLSSSCSEVKSAIYHAIEQMEELSEMYPVGGAADRLKLQDSESGAALPAALLSFNGRTMLAGLVEDLQVREYLYYKIKGKQIFVPIAMMTSQEKNNHEHILNLCTQHNWFHRPREKFSFFCQPLVPVVDGQGSWVLSGPSQPLLKPGGHGVIWKLARDCGVFSWLKEQGATKSIIRQINNPISSEDYGLLAFSGYGLREGKRFGFASCERQVRASEGINVVVEEETEEGFSYTLTNIEYCDFSIYNIQDEPVEEGGKYSKFPSNTNLLFVDLLSIEEVLGRSPIPGMLINKKKVSFRTDLQEIKEEEVSRLESTMQNIADCFSYHCPERLVNAEMHKLDSYITFNTRRKTISATKKEYAKGFSFLETPEGCFLDVISNMQELLQEACGFYLPQIIEGMQPPFFLFYYHSALGPLYSVIGKKIRKGSLTLGSELKLHIAECDMADLHVDGSLHVIAERVIGEVNSDGILQYSEKVGRCTLKNVRVRNAGIDYSQANVFWKQEIYRKEHCRIFLEGESEFYAEDVELEGNIDIRVEHGYKMTVKKVEGKVVFYQEKLDKTSWSWQYQFTEDLSLNIVKKFY